MRPIRDFLPKLGPFLEKHVKTRSQADLLQEIRDQVCQAYDLISGETDKKKGAEKILHVQANTLPLLVDRGSRRKKLSPKTISTSVALFVTYYPLAIAQLALKSLDTLSRLRYKSPLNPRRITDDTRKALENIFISLDRIFKLERVEQENAAQMQQALLEIKLELIHELRPFFKKPKYFKNAQESAEEVLNTLSQAGSITQSEEIKALIPALNPQKAKVTADASQSLALARENLGQLSDMLEKLSARPRYLRLALESSHIIFSDFDLFIRAHPLKSSLPALIINGISHAIMMTTLGIPGAKVSALASPAPIHKLSKTGPNEEQQQLIEQMILYLDALYHFQNCLAGRMHEAKANDSELALKKQISALIAKVELNLYPYVNHDAAFRSQASNFIQNSTLKFPDKIRALLEIENPASLLTYLSRKSPELASIAAFSVGMEANHRFTDESGELLKYFNDKILKDEDGKDLLKLSPEQKKAIDNLAKFFILGLANELKIIMMLQCFASTPFSETHSRREFLSKTRVALLGGAAASFGIHKLRYLRPSALKFIQARLADELKNCLRNTDINHGEIEKLAAKIAKDEAYIMKYLSYLLNNAGIGPMTSLFLYNNPTLIEDTMHELANRLDELAGIAKNTLRI